MKPPAPTVVEVLVLIATAEPRGAYHLTPLAGACSNIDASFVHLLPYLEPVQGHAAVPVAADASLIDTCDRVVLTGGTFSPWTELVYRRAMSLQKPVCFSELAYVGAPAPLSCPPVLVRTTATSSDGAVALQRYLGPRDVEVVGTPALDALPPWRPVPGRVLLLSTSNISVRDPSATLRAVGRILLSDGWDVRVRLHPREDPTPWEGFELVKGESQATSAAAAQAVIGYPGSAHVLAAAVGVPVVSLAPTEELRRIFTPSQRAAMAAHTTAVDDTLAALHTAQPVPQDRVEPVVGPIGGAAARLVDAWVRPLD